MLYLVWLFSFSKKTNFMRTIKMITILALVFISKLSFAQVKNTNDHDNIVKRLSSFYSYYIVKSLDPVNDKISRDTMKKYCTASFLKQTYYAVDPERDADVMLDVQDFDTAWVHTLKITKVSDGDKKKYSICVWLVYEKIYHCIHVALKKEQGEWKIDKVIQTGN